MNDMERIQRGLEEFLEQELEGESGEQEEPELYDLNDEEAEEREGAEADEEAEEEEDEEADEGEEEEEFDEDEPEVIDINRNTGKRRRDNVAPVEDWDSQPRRRGSTSGGKEASEGRRRRTDDQNRSHRDWEDDRSDRKKKPRRERHRRKHRGLRRLIITLIVLAVILFGGLYLLEGPIYSLLNYEEIESLAGESMQEDGVVNVLLIGNDSRENGEDGRSDAMILLSISKKTKKITMTSLLRDMYVEIPGHDGNRLNAAYAYGGAELLLETVEQNLGITVNRYVLVNFEAFANLVDAVGGVDLELTTEEIELVNGYLVEYNLLTGREEGTDYMDTSVSGLVHLNGPQALAYSRNRYIGTDFGRTERQRKVLTAVIQELPQALMTNPKGVLGGLMPNLTTNLTRWECYRLSLMAPKLLSYDIESASIPLEGTYEDVTIREMSVLQVDFEANRAYLQELLYGTGETSTDEE